MSIADELSRISAAMDAVENGKTAIAEAITAKGVDTLPGSGFDTLATNISLIESGGDGGNDKMFFTPVSEIPAGRGLSIPTDYNKCVIVCCMVASTKAYSGFGYNKLVKNVANGFNWSNDGTGFGFIWIDNVNGVLTQESLYAVGELVTYGKAIPTERVRSIEPHWLDSKTPVTGGYWTFIVEE